ncbi:MAG: hypothetical protein D6753_05145 [Planctomycetota bacterium]|nr:MAG: hypothetical protein D6753_05145 [Planctomycetota bacterium]
MLLLGQACPSLAAGPFDGKSFHGRIAYSCDGNHNDPDDWASSPMALAILAQFGCQQNLVHFDYNSILNNNFPVWEHQHRQTVMEAARRFGYDARLFFDCQQDVDAAVADLVRHINASSADNPLYFVIAGPMEVPARAIHMSNPIKRRFVYCISHSSWNDGFSARYDFPVSKRSIIESGVQWVQIRDQSLLSTSPYPKSREARDADRLPGLMAPMEAFAPYRWLERPDRDDWLFLWQQFIVSGRPDASDAGMIYFLLTGDEQATPEKLRQLFEGNLPPPISERQVIRLEAENFVELVGYQPQYRKDRSISHRLFVRPVGDAHSARLATRVDQPYMAFRTLYDVAIRYMAGQQPTVFELQIGGQESEQVTAPTGSGWQTVRIPAVQIGRRQRMVLAVHGAPVAIDYVELRRSDSSTLAADPPTASPAAGPATGHARFAVTEPLDDPAALPGQVIVGGKNPGYLKINGGRPLFLTGPDNPEDFLYMGELQPDGTRAGGGQMEIIEFLGQAGVNACHMLMFRMQRCNIKDEGDDTHCPFINHDPSQPLNEKVLDQWDGWLRELEKRGIIVHLEFYNDATDVERMGWVLDSNGRLHPDEERFVRGIVQRFRHHKNIMWGIEESANKLPRTWLKHYRALSRLIAEVDGHHHPIVHSLVTPETKERDIHPDRVMSSDLRDAPHVRVITWLHIPPYGEDFEAQHRAYLKYAGMDADRFVRMKNETEYHRIDRRTARVQNWACIFAGMHSLEANWNVSRQDRRPRAIDGGIALRFIERTNWHRCQPHDELATGSTRWVLADPGREYLAYSYDADGPMGLRQLPAGTYDVLWFDTVTGRAVEQQVKVDTTGDVLWPVPAELGPEVALRARAVPKD